MNALKVSFRNVVLGLSALIVLATNIVAANYLITVPTATSQWSNGVIYSVPAGANYEWEVQGGARVVIGGGGLNVVADGAYGFQADVGSTSYADTISYQLNVYSSGGEGMFYLGW